MRAPYPRSSPPITAAANDGPEIFQTGANRPARMAASNAPRMMPKSITEVTSINTLDFSAAACAGAVQYDHDATSTPIASNHFAPHSANADVTPHGRPPMVSVAMLTMARPTAPATSGHGPVSHRGAPARSEVE